MKAHANFRPHVFFSHFLQLPSPSGAKALAAAKEAEESIDAFNSKTQSHDDDDDEDDEYSIENNSKQKVNGKLTQFKWEMEDDVEL